MYYILEGKEPKIVKDFLEWARMFNVANRTIKLTDIQEVRISTVFLGIDHAFHSGIPILFETMIFGGEHDGYQDRYRTFDEAEAGHEKAINLVLEA